MRTVRTEENIASVSESVAEDREMSIRCRSQQLGLCYSTTWKILRKDLGVKPYKIQLVQELKPNDLPQRRIFSEWALEKLAENPLFLSTNFAAFGVKSNQKPFKNCPCIPKNALFGVVCTLMESLDRIFSKMLLDATLR